MRPATVSGHASPLAAPCGVDDTAVPPRRPRPPAASPFDTARRAGSDPACGAFALAAAAAFRARAVAAQAFALPQILVGGRAGVLAGAP